MRETWFRIKWEIKRNVIKAEYVNILKYKTSQRIKTLKIIGKNAETVIFTILN